MADLKEILDSTHSVLNNLISTLNATTVSGSLSLTALTAWKTTFNALETTVTVSLQSVNALTTTIDSTKLQNQNSLASYSILEKQSEIAFLNAQSSLASLQAKLDTALFQSQTQVSQAENALENAKKSFEQAKNSQEIQMISARSNFSNVQTQLSLAEIRTDNTIVRSPILGVVTKRYVNLGQEVLPNTPLFEVKNLDSIKVVLQISQENLEQIIIGDEVIVDDKFTGIVSRIEPELSQVSKKAVVEVALIRPFLDLALGSLVKVEFPLNSLNVKILLPLKAVEIGESWSRVKVVEKGKLAWREIELGGTRGEYIEALNGLGDEDLVVIEAGEFLEEGMEVEISNF